MGTFGKVLIGGGVLIGGYFAYENVLKPYLVQRELEAKARALAASKGISYQDALAQVGSLACQAVVTYYQGGKPPNDMEKLACSVAGKIAGIVVTKGGKLVVKGVVVGAKDVAKGAVAAEHGVVSAGKAIGHGVSKILHLFGIDGV